MDTAVPSFEAVYDAHADFIFRSLRAQGVPDASIEDALQDVFVVAHRRLNEFEGRASIKTWLFRIATHVGRDYKRALRRKGESVPLPDAVVDAGPGPMDSLVQAEAIRAAERLLNELDDEKRIVFLLAEIEQMSAPEIAEALGVKLNTVYSRLRLAREAFNKAIERQQRRGR